MEGYIGGVKRLLRQSRAVSMPPEAEIQSAIKVLSVSPVAGYPAFMEEEVRLLAAYRIAFSQYDEIWRRIALGEELAWIYAIHEAAEIQFLQNQGVNPFRISPADPFFSAAHLQASLVELQYLQGWSQQLAKSVPMLAIEMENPVRKALPSAHRVWIARLQVSQGWSAPEQHELEQARQFWDAVMKWKQP